MRDALVAQRGSFPVGRAVSLRAYPNPAAETVTLDVHGPLPAGGRLELVVLATGRVVRTVEAAAAIQLAVADLSPGVYAARLVGTEGVRATCKVVVMH